MFLFRAFDLYVVKMLGGHPKDKHWHLKHHTKFCIQQQALGNTWVFYFCFNMVVFGMQPNCGVSVSAFILLYCQCLWLNMHINILQIHTSHFIMWQVTATVVSTWDSECPATGTWSDEECTWKESLIAVEDVVQGNKGQETSERVES
jgi:hypothetical protein